MFIFAGQTEELSHVKGEPHHPAQVPPSETARRMVGCFRIFIFQNKLLPEGRFQMAGALFEAARDEFLHDFIGSAINALNAGIGPHFCDCIFLHEAVTTMKLQAFVKHFSFGVC